MGNKTRVLFVCIANAARSQMAEALLRHIDPDGYEAFSAGIAPTEVDLNARAVLEHLGVSTVELRSKSLEEFAGQSFDYVISLCDKSALECRTLPAGTEHVAWHFEDPATSSRHDVYRHTLHELHERLRLFVVLKSKA